MAQSFGSRVWKVAKLARGPAGLKSARHDVVLVKFVLGLKGHPALRADVRAGRRLYVPLHEDLLSDGPGHRSVAAATYPCPPESNLLPGTEERQLS